MWKNRLNSIMIQAAVCVMGSAIFSMTLFSQHIQEWKGDPGITLQGKIVGDRYFARNGVFSVAVPKPVWDGYVTDHYPQSNIAGVMFFNDVGYLLKVEVDDLPPEVCSLISCHPTIKEEILDALFYDVLIPQLKDSVPGLQVLHERKLSLDHDETALYAVLDMPESATLVNNRTGRCLDSKRGYMLVFSQNRRLVVFSMQDTYSLLPGCAENAAIYLKERLLSHLIKIHGTYQPAVLSLTEH